ncbi:WYL domain-containing protein [Sphingomonas soli]|uniref:WYL domain-containing protein n=1 Tax=Sphingomonas soli TaxID=266127 RepID=UPI0008330683|nr:WYL domain-containing protein [Sphingomonas soli]
MTSSADSADQGPTGPVATMFEAVIRQLCVSVTYNRTRMILAPHILYMRGDALYTDAFIVSRENMLPREPKMGTFKIDGLNDVTLTQRPFEPSALFDPDQAKYAIKMMAIEPQDVAA